MESVVGLAHCQLQLDGSLAALEAADLSFRGCVARAPMHMTPNLTTAADVWGRQGKGLSGEQEVPMET